MSSVAWVWPCGERNVSRGGKFGRFELRLGKNNMVQEGRDGYRVQQACGLIMSCLIGASLLLVVQHSEKCAAFLACIRGTFTGSQSCQEIEKGADAV